MAFFNQMFGGQGSAPMLGGGGGASAFSPNGGMAGGMNSQILQLLMSMQNRGVPGAAVPGGGAVPGAPGPPQMPTPPQGGAMGGGAGGGVGLGPLAALAARGGAAGMPGGATATPGGGNLLSMLSANPNLLKMLQAGGKGGPGAAAMPGQGAGAAPGAGTGGLY